MRAGRSYVIDTLRLAGPVALGRLGIIGMSFADVVVVGQLAPDELPHQALGLAPVGVLLVSAVGLLMGVQVLAARAIGEGKPEAAGGALRGGLLLSMFAGLGSAGLLWIGGAGLFTAFGIAPELAEPSARVMAILALSVPLHLFYVAGAYFLEALRRPGGATAIMWIANAVNLGLNLLWVPDHGAIGSAWATVGARAFLCVAVLAWIAALRGVEVFGSAMTPGVGVRALLGVGVAAALSQAVEAGAFSAMTVIAGRVGPHAVSAYQILVNIIALVFMVAMGMAAAAAVLTAEASGRGAPADAARAGWTALGLNTVAMIVLGVAMYAFPDLIARAYTADAALAALVSGALWIGALVLVPDGGQVVTASALRARGDNWFPTASHIFAYAVVMPALGYWFGERMGLGAAGLMLAIFWSSVISCGVLIARWWMLSRR